MIRHFNYGIDDYLAFVAERNEVAEAKKKPETAIAKKRSLYDIDAAIDQEMAVFEDLLLAIDDEDTDAEICQQIAQWLDSLKVELHQKLDGYCYLIEQHIALAKVRKEKADQLRSLSAVNTGTAERLKRLLLEYLQSRGIKRITTNEHNIWSQRNSAEGVEVFDEAQLPAEYWNTITIKEPDLLKLKAALKAGADVPGAKLKERGYHLRITCETTFASGWRCRSWRSRQRSRPSESRRATIRMSIMQWCGSGFGS